MPADENPNLKPTPDDFLTIIRRQQLGKLKIYLGRLRESARPTRCWSKGTASGSKAWMS